MAASAVEPRGDVTTALAVLRQRFGDRVQTGEAMRRQHGHTLTWIVNQPPDGVVWPLSTEEVRDIVMIAGQDPYSWKGIDDMAKPFVRPSGEGGCSKDGKK